MTLTDEEMFFKSEHEVEEHVNDVVYPILLQYHHLQIMRYDDNCYSTVIGMMKKLYSVLRDEGVDTTALSILFDKLERDYEAGDGVVLH